MSTFHDPFKRWAVWPFARGAYGESGGHAHVLGLTYTWLRPTHPQLRPSREVTFSLFGIVALRWDYRGFDWALGTIELKRTPARWRFGKRQEARSARLYRRRLKASLKLGSWK